MNWRLAGVIAVADLRRRVRDRTLIVSGIVGPFALALIISLAFSGGTGDLRIGLQDLDGSRASSGMVDGFVAGVNGAEGGDSDGEGGEGGASGGLEVVVLDADQDAASVATSQDGPGTVIVVPEGFGNSLGGDRPAPLQVVADSGDTFTAEIASAIAEGIASEFDRTRLLVVAGAVASGSQPSDELVDAAGAARPAIGIARAEAGETYSAASYFAPAMTMFFLFFTLGTGTSGLIADRRTGVLSRMRATPAGDTTILAGRAAGVVGLGLVSTITLWAVSGPVMGANWGPPVAALTVIACVVLAITGLAVLVMAFARTESQVSGATSILGFGMALLGGTFFPTRDLPGVLSSLSLLTPNGLAQRAFTELALGASLLSIWWVPVGLLAMATISGAVALIVIRRRVLT